MKKIWLLTALLVGGLLLTGCNNNVHYEEEFSEYWLVHWPNWTITLEDFEKEWNILIELNIEQCNSPEKACVPVIVKEDGKLYTPYEYNETPYDDKKDRYTYYTDLETFHKVTWLKEATSEYVEWSNNVYFFDPYVKFYKTNEEREAILKEKIENQTIEEENTEKTVEDNKDKIPVLDTDIETLIKSFTWSILNWTDRNPVRITEDYTLYYNDNFWIAVILWKEWKWWNIEFVEDPEWYPSIKFIWSYPFVTDVDFDIYDINIIDNEKYSALDSWDLGDKNFLKRSTLWNNNKYSFVQTVTNVGHDIIYETFPTLECNERIENWYNYWMACDWYEIINWKHVRTWKNWIEQLFSNWLLFYDIN